jgi:hypothetical protein
MKLMTGRRISKSPSRKGSVPILGVDDMKDDEVTGTNHLEGIELLQPQRWTM